MTPILHSTPLRAALDDIIDTHGRWRVLLALLLRPLQRAKRLPPMGLSDHLRRDIGLEPLPPNRGWLR
jgi:hypothetical protein